MDGGMVFKLYEKSQYAKTLPPLKALLIVCPCVFCELKQSKIRTIFLFDKINILH